MITIRPATLEDAHSLAGRLRFADVEELMASSGHEPLEGLLVSLELSVEAYAAELDGEVIALFGVGQHTLDPKCGVPWLLGSDELRRVPKALVKHSAEMVERWLQKWPTLCNFVDARHVESIHWLERMGFILLKLHHRFGAAQLPFIQFVRYADV